MAAAIHSLTAGDRGRSVLRSHTHMCEAEHGEAEIVLTRQIVPGWRKVLENEHAFRDIFLLCVGKEGTTGAAFRP